MDNVRWRALETGDLPALEALDAVCVQADGPASVTWISLADLLAEEGTARIGGWLDDGTLVAAGWMRRVGTRAWLGGQVHPAYRRRGLGTQVLRWTEAQAAPIQPTELIIRNEAFTDSSAALYAQEGFTCDFVEHWMQRDLDTPLPEIAAAWPTVPWSAETAPQFFAVYEAAFAERRGPTSPPPDLMEDWIADYDDDPDFRPDLSLLALDGAQPVGFVTTAIIPIPHIGQRVGLISQVGSHPAWRGRAVAAGLITTVLAACRAEGLPAVALHVNTNNAKAEGLYKRLGFTHRGRRAKYSKSGSPSLADPAEII